MKNVLVFGFMFVMALMSCERTHRYSIEITVDGNGTAKTDRAKAEPGTVVALTATPDEGFFFDEWRVLKGRLELSNITANPTTFPMPERNVSIEAGFTKDFFTLIPDPLFKEYCQQFDTNGNSIMSQRETENVTVIEIPSTMDYYGPVIESFSGIEMFANLKELYCGNSKLTGLDVSGNAELLLLYCVDNDLSAEAIRNILSTLPMRTVDDGAEVHCYYNPGSSQITAEDRKIAEDKNWRVHNF